MPFAQWIPPTARRELSTTPQVYCTCELLRRGAGKVVVALARCKWSPTHVNCGGAEHVRTLSPCLALCSPQQTVSCTYDMGRRRDACRPLTRFSVLTRPRMVGKPNSTAGVPRIFGPVRLAFMASYGRGRSAGGSGSASCALCSQGGFSTGVGEPSRSPCACVPARGDFDAKKRESRVLDLPIARVIASSGPESLVWGTPVLRRRLTSIIRPSTSLIWGAPVLRRLPI
jgi:hypothetical protein